jgi:NAD(P)-dependent dehydrogenase (short-subunit alcohol dehydrogenase family)
LETILTEQLLDAVLVTGANGFLGEFFCLELAKRGYTVVATDLQNEIRFNIQKFNHLIHYLKMDVTQESSVLQAEKNIKNLNLFTRVLVNNAAINHQVTENLQWKETSRLENFSLDSFRKELAVGIEGAILCSKIFGLAMAISGRGNIVNISSDLGIISPDQRLYEKTDTVSEQQPVKPLSYSIIKHGIIGLTKYLATYWPGVRCNALVPGGVRKNQPEEFQRKISERIPLSRMAEPHEIATALCFLVSNDSTYMNGANLVVDGGRTIW